MPETDTTGSAASGVVGNERLTAMAGAVILLCAGVEVATVPIVTQLLTLHFFVGVLMLGPVAVKTGSTGWRFVRYYSGSPPYRRKGPPRLILRTLSPVLLAATLVVIGSGIALAITGPAPPVLLALHKVSFIFWLVTIVVHGVAYAWRVPRMVVNDWTGSTDATVAPGRALRVVVNVVALGAGIAGAALITPLDRKWPQWLAEQGEAGLGIRVLVVFTIGGVVIASIRRVWQST